MTGVQLAHGSPLPAHTSELCAEVEGGVGLIAVGTDPKCFRGQPFDLIGVAGDLRSNDRPKRAHPVQCRLVELLGERPGDLEATFHLVDVSSAHGSVDAPNRGEEQQAGVTDALGPNQGVGRPVQRLFEQWRHVERVRGVVEDPHDGGVVTRGVCDGDRLVGESLTAVERAPPRELRTQGGQHERPVEVVAGQACES